MANLDLKLLVSMYLQGKSTKTKFTDAPIMYQTNWYYEFSGYIEGKIRDSEHKALDKMQSKQEPNKAESKLKSTPKPKTAPKKRK
jgi:hypothetical protein